MTREEILNIVNEPSKHIQMVKIDGKASIAYSAKFVELLELIPTMLTKADIVAMLTDIRDDIASNYLIDVDTGKIISGAISNFKAQKLLDSINNEITADHWVDDADHYICPRCGFRVANPKHFIGCRCPQCGFQPKKNKEKNND